MDIITVSKSTKEYTDYPLHQHACWEILFSIRGNGTIRIDDDIMPFHEGSIFVIPPNHPHCKKSPTGYIDGCIFAQNIQMDDNHFWSVEDDYEKTLFTLFDIAYYAQERKGTYSKKVIDSVGEAVYSVLLELRSQQDAYDQSVDRFIHLLIDNIGNREFDLSGAVDETGYNPNYFRKLFKESTGNSPLEYFTNLRVEEAKRRLKLYGKTESVREIAEKAGFTDPYYFSRKFKQKTGMSPREFLNSLNSVDQDMITRQIVGEDDDPEYEIRRRIRDDRK